MMLVACGAEDSSASTAIEVDGITVFKGLFLGEGPVAAKLPEIWQDPVYVKLNNSLSEEEQQEILEAKDALVAQIKASDPSYFLSLAREIQSGNPVLVERALENTLATVQSTLGISDADTYDESSVTPQCGLA